jgi:hypothetical protein
VQGHSFRMAASSGLKGRTCTSGDRRHEDMP